MYTFLPWNEPEFLLVHHGIRGNLLRLNLRLLGLPDNPPNPKGAMTDNEYKEASSALTRILFGDEIRESFCGLCGDKSQYNFDSIVIHYGME